MEVRHTASPRKELRRRPFLGLLPGFAVPPSLSANWKPSPAHLPLHSRVDQFQVLLGRTRRFLRQGRSILAMKYHSNSRPTSRVSTADRQTLHDELLLPPTFQQICLEKTQIAAKKDLRFSLRRLFLPHIRFTAKSSAPLGSSCQSRLCSSARRINPKPRRARFRALRLRSAPEIDSASLRSSLAIYETNVFYWPAKA